MLNRLLSCIALLTTMIFLTGCPQQKEMRKQQAVQRGLINNIDSSTLINHLAYLSSEQMEGRETATPGNQLARNYIANIFDSLQLDKVNNHRLQSFVYKEGQQAVNIIGIIKGTSIASEYIAITAHYDHLGKRNGQIYYGADDNASGTAALLAMMQYFKKHPPKHSMLFIAFDAEEKGLRGSKHFIDSCPLPLSSIKLNINMDMVSRNDSNEIFATGTSHYPFLKKYIDSVQPYSPVNVRFGHDGQKPGADDWTSQSDHFAFHLKNIPYLYFGVEDHPDYHRPGDTFDKVNKHFYFQVCTMITAVAQLLDKQAALQ